MPTHQLNINEQLFTVEAEDDMPLLWVLRDVLNMTGTKYGCGVASCGACTVLLNETAVRSCATTIKSCAGAKITTIEGLSDALLHPVQQAWAEVNVPQCGYCQAGQVMSVAGMLKRNKQPSKETIEAVMSQVICRCGTYDRIRRAIDIAVAKVNNP
jgi:aerobic-type carbon monoxide dehydrogenase small subunit (CoxS/CutS family)